MGVAGGVLVGGVLDRGPAALAQSLAHDPRRGAGAATASTGPYVLGADLRAEAWLQLRERVLCGLPCHRRRAR